MDLHRLLDIQDVSSVPTRKVIQYPYLFDINLDPTMSHEQSQLLTSWNCDMVLECLTPLSCEVFQRAFSYETGVTGNHRSRDGQQLEKTGYPSVVRVDDCDDNYDTKREKREKPFLDYDKMPTIVEPINPLVSYSEHHKATSEIISLDELTWTCIQTKHHSNLHVLEEEMKKLFHADYVVAGRAFTDTVLTFGTLGNYYLQYLANGLFGHPNAVMAIHNKRHIVEQFTQQRTLGFAQNPTIFQQLAETMYLTFMETAPERWETVSGHIPFEKGDILECMVQIRGHIRHPDNPNLSRVQQVQMRTIMNSMFHKSGICDDEGTLYPQTWKLRFVLL